MSDKLRIKCLKLNNYRNHKFLKVEPEKDIALIGIFDNVLAEPLIDLFVSVAVVSLIAACI